MDLITFLALIAAITIVLIILYIAGLFFIDCDYGLAWAEKFGKSVGMYN